MNKSKAEDFANKISNNTDLLKTYTKDWSVILRELKGDVKVTKESEYMHVANRKEFYRSATGCN